MAPCYPNTENIFFIMDFSLEFIRASVLHVLLILFSSLEGSLSASFYHFTGQEPRYIDTFYLLCVSSAIFGLQFPAIE